MSSVVRVYRGWITDGKWAEEVDQCFIGVTLTQRYKMNRKTLQETPDDTR